MLILNLPDIKFFDPLQRIWLKTLITTLSISDMTKYLPVIPHITTNLMRVSKHFEYSYILLL